MSSQAYYPPPMSRAKRGAIWAIILTLLGILIGFYAGRQSALAKYNLKNKPVQPVTVSPVPATFNALPDYVQDEGMAKAWEKENLL